MIANGNDRMVAVGNDRMVDVRNGCYRQTLAFQTGHILVQLSTHLEGTGRKKQDPIAV